MSTIALQTWATPERVQEAREVGRGRYQKAKERQRLQPYGDPGEENRLYIDGWSCLAEALVASWLELEWCKELRDDLSIKPPDVGSKVEVKWTQHHPGHLIAHDTDIDDWVIVFTRRELPEIEVVGWTTVSFAKQARFQNHPKARNPKDYWVPPKQLLLPELLFQMRRSLA
jgi:hypothetical protein